MLYLLLAAAIVAEIGATMSLRASDGLTRLWPSLGAAAGYAVAFWLLSLVLARGMPVGVAYAIWAAAGVAAVALLGWWLLGEDLTLIQAAGIVLVVAGVAALELGGAH